MQYEHIPSPNFSRREKSDISMIVIHSISLPPGEYNNSYINDFFTNTLDDCAHPYFASIKELKVSAHLFIKRDGFIIQYVDFKDKAWHAGKSFYAGQKNLNECSIGIELEGTDESAFDELQYDALNSVLEQLVSTYPIKYIVGHSDIAPKRKTDPGALFQWDKLLQGAILKHYR